MKSFNIALQMNNLRCLMEKLMERKQYAWVQYNREFLSI